MAGVHDLANRSRVKGSVYGEIREINNKTVTSPLNQSTAK